MIDSKKIVSRQYLIHEFYEDNSFTQEYWDESEEMIKEYTQWLITQGYIQYKDGCEPTKSKGVRST
ncbi:MAG: hypothetical protein ACTSRU_19850 [Candidatus Hodarchaeales archaeon]